MARRPRRSGLPALNETRTLSDLKRNTDVLRRFLVSRPPYTLLGVAGLGQPSV